MDTIASTGVEGMDIVEIAEDLALRLNALQSPVRLRILRILREQGGKINVDQLVALLSQTKHIEQPSVTHHLQILRRAGLVDFKKRGLFSYYFVKDAEIPTLFNGTLAFAGLQP